MSWDLVGTPSGTGTSDVPLLQARISVLDCRRRSIVSRSREVIHSAQYWSAKTGCTGSSSGLPHMRDIWPHWRESRKDDGLLQLNIRKHSAMVQVAKHWHPREVVGFPASSSKATST